MEKLKNLLKDEHIAELTNVTFGKNRVCSTYLTEKLD